MSHDENEENVTDRLTQRVCQSSFCPRKPDFDECWTKIEKVVLRVMTAQSCTTREWDDCFFDVYALCTATQNYPIHLYNMIIKFYIGIVEGIQTKLKSLQGIDLIEAYAHNWKIFNTGVSHVHELFSYLNKLVKRETMWVHFCRDFPDVAQRLGYNSMHISALSRKIWQEYLLLPIQEQLYSVIWKEFVNVRQQDYIVQPPSSVRESLDSFIDVCFPSDKDRMTLMFSVENGTYFSNRLVSPEKLIFYENYFETRFLKDTECYFKNSPVVQDLSQSMYEKMSTSSAILENESRLCRAFMFVLTVEKTLKALRALFVLGPLDRFVIALPQYVDNEQKAELNLAYKLLNPFKEEGLSFLIQEYERHVTQVLIDKINTVKLTPAGFVEIICTKHAYFQKFAEEVFEGSQDMNDGYRRAVETVINDIDDREPYYAAKLVARQMDTLLKRSARKSEDLEEKMDETITVFRFIRDKDTFLKIYQRLFSTRLLSKLFCSLPIESLMIEKLKSSCGNDYTNKLVRMYTDFENSRQLSEGFYKSQCCNCRHRKEDEVVVIQTCAWPVLSSKEEHNMVGFKLPSGLDSLTQCFKNFYEEKHNGRILNYAYHVSTADILVSVGARLSTVTMTVPQAALLLLFNTQNQLTVSELAKQSGLDFDYTCSCIKALIDFKILKTQTQNRDLYTADTEIQFNSGFVAQRSRAHLPLPASTTRTQDTSNIVPSQQETSQDRKSVIECAIVRAMKTRKVMLHRELVDFIRVVTDDRFIPENQFIKRCIESLIDKHFIQRTGVDIYEYLA